MSAVGPLLSHRDIFMSRSVFVRVRGAVGGNGVRPNGFVSASFRVSSCGRNASLHLEYARTHSGKLSESDEKKTKIRVIPYLNV